MELRESCPDRHKEVPALGFGNAHTDQVFDLIRRNQDARTGGESDNDGVRDVFYNSSELEDPE